MQSHDVASIIWQALVSGAAAAEAAKAAAEARISRPWTTDGQGLTLVHFSA
jgi:hypothetical protein